VKPTVTPEQIEKIKTLSGRTLQKEIAANLGLSVHLVRKIQRRFGLLPNCMEPLSPEVERKVLELFRQGHGAPFISKTLNVPQHRAQGVAEEHRFRHAPGVVGHRYYLDLHTKRAIRRELRTSERAIAKKFGVTREWLSRFRLEMWRHPKKKEQRNEARPATPPQPIQARYDTDDCLRLVTRISEKCFDGRLPDMDDETFVRTIMAAFEPTLLANQPRPVVDSFRVGLREAVSDLRLAQTAANAGRVN